ncbi:MAG: Ppx/GppA phosphatase family protein [Oligoflexia bacterium]|nr:Ppx/GppA phosphatase family protein [Oligoflexia bacterium]
MNLRSSIDLGTNTCLLLIAELNPEGTRILRAVEDHSTIVRLGEGVDQHRALQPQAIERTLACLVKYAAAVRARGLDPAATIAVATSQARDARNGAEFFARVERETGFRFRIISGDEEAKLTFKGGLLPGLSAEHSAVIDIGGGSTEIISSRGGQSVDIGSVRYTERYLKSDPVTDAEFWACQDAIDSALKPLENWRHGLPGDTQLIAVAGTAATLGAWYLGLEKFDAGKLDQLTITRGDIHRMVEELKWRTVAERTRLPGMEPKRADVLLAGALILWRAMELLGFSQCRISTRGLRYGALT